VLRRICPESGGIGKKVGTIRIYPMKLVISKSLGIDRVSESYCSGILLEQVTDVTIVQSFVVVVGAEYACEFGPGEIGFGETKEER